MAAAGEENTIINEPNDYCPICLNDFEEENLKYLSCSCQIRTCIGCIKDYLLNSMKDPHCHKCNIGWSRDFQYKHLGKQWINGSYKRYRKKLILDREKSRMSETMPFVNDRLMLNKLTNELKEKNDKIKEVTKQMQDELTKLRFQKRSIQYKKRGLQLKISNYLTDAMVVIKEKHTLIRPCQKEGCRGFVDISYICGLCQTKVCKKCFEIKEEEHTCDENNIKAATLIKRETKQCPKCAIPIYKVSGCDQMWCTQCQVSFSWRKGTIMGGSIHNPHYYQWNNQSTQVPINLEEKVNNCNILISNQQLSSLHHLLRKNNILYGNTLDNNHRGSRHIRFILNNLQEEMDKEQNNLDLRIKYLTNEIDDEQLGKLATSRDNIREKKASMMQIIELVHSILIENFVEFYNSSLKLYKDYDVNNALNRSGKDILKKNYERFIENIENMRIYANNELIKLGNNYKMKVYYIPYNFIIADTMKSVEDMKKLKTIEEMKGIVETYKICNKLEEYSMNRILKYKKTDLSKELSKIVGG